MQYCMYLRKSRADAEAEERGEGETLARHERLLREVAKKQQLIISDVYREVVSGDSITARPEMQRLLHDVEKGKWDGVLVVEIERLARGDTIDQGTVAQTFKVSDTKIITPMKTYDPQNEFDEEYFEFGLFMSRREYKTINRRLQRGRIASQREGNFVASVAPYGYERVKLAHEKGFTLTPREEEAEIIRLMYQWYTEGIELGNGEHQRIGVQLISRRLNSMGVPTRSGRPWSLASIRDMLSNPVYIGKIRIKGKRKTKQIVNGEVRYTYLRDYKHAEIVEGKHPAIIDEHTYSTAQEYLAKNRPLPVPSRHKVMSPLAGLVVCAECGKHMNRRPYAARAQEDTLMCPTVGCPNVSSKLCLVEQRILDALQEYVDDIKMQWGAAGKPKPTKLSTRINDINKAIGKAQRERELIGAQLLRTHDLLEQGVYDTDTFLERSSNLKQRIHEVDLRIKQLSCELKETDVSEQHETLIPKIEHLLTVYSSLENAKDKNDMLKAVIEKVVYRKTQKSHWKTGAQDNFEIVLYPRVILENYMITSRN